MSGALLRYRVMAYVVGVMLLVLVLIGVPLQYAAGRPGVVAVVGPIHGFLYIVYLVAAFDLARRARFSLLQMVGMAAAGFLPFLAFFVEHRVTISVRELMAA
jgi:integral membrane protein